MVNLQNVKVLVPIRQASLTSGATGTSDTIDTRGYRHAKLILYASTSDVVSNTYSTLHVRESDATVVSNFATAAALVGGTATSSTVGFVIPNAETATSSSAFMVLNINLRRRKRYLQLRLTPQTTVSSTLVCILSRPEQSPIGTATDQENSLVVVNA